MESGDVFVFVFVFVCVFVQFFLGAVCGGKFGEMGIETCGGASPNCRPVLNLAKAASAIHGNSPHSIYSGNGPANGRI